MNHPEDNTQLDHHQARSRTRRWVATLLVAATSALCASPVSSAEVSAEDSWTSEDAWDIPGEYLVDFKDDSSPGLIQSTLKALGLNSRPTRLEEETRIEIVTVSAGVAGGIQNVIAKLRGNGDVEGVEPHARVKALWEPNDPLYEKQWHLKRIGTDDGWSFGIGRGVTVAVVDTGIACENFKTFTKASDLNTTRCVDGWNFVSKNGHANDDHGHGTHVAGTIAQSTDNGVGAAGIAFGARLMPIKVLSADGWGTTSSVADGIRWAADHGAHVINLSLGGPRNSGVLQRAVDHARARGSVVVAAAGNSGGSVGFPGASAGVIGVSATDSNNKLARFSSRGHGVDIAAPGVAVVQQTICERGQNRCEIFPAYNGTSMASPHVAGVAAALVGLGVNDASEVEAILKAQALSLDDSEAGKKFYGAGLLQADAVMSNTHRTQWLTRLLALLGSVLVAFSWAKKKGEVAVSMTSPTLWAAGLFSGVGLLFFLPGLASRHLLWLDLLSRPAVEWDLLAGVSLHRFLPLAHFFVPVALTAVFLRFKGLAPALAGVSLGTAAYLMSVAVLGQLATPFGSLLTVLWCVANALACLSLGALLLRRA